MMSDFFVRARAFSPSALAIASSWSLSFDRGEPDLAYAEARVARAAREACKTTGKTPVVLDGSACADGLTRP